MNTPVEPARRLSPALRRSQLLAAGRLCLARDGLTAFSLEAVAREAGVTAPLPRHYFGSREGMLLALAEEVVEDVLDAFLSPDGGTLAARLDRYLQLIEASPWGHSLWMHAGEVHPDLERLASASRRKLAVASGFPASWDSMSAVDRFGALGWVGYVESVVAQWVADGCTGREVVVDALLGAAERLLALQPAQP